MHRMRPTVAEMATLLRRGEFSHKAAFWNTPLIVITRFPFVTSEATRFEALVKEHCKPEPPFRRKWPLACIATCLNHVQRGDSKSRGKPVPPLGDFPSESSNERHFGSEARSNDSLYLCVQGLCQPAERSADPQIVPQPAILRQRSRRCHPRNRHRVRDAKVINLRHCEGFPVLFELTAAMTHPEAKHRLSLLSDQRIPDCFNRCCLTRP